MSAPPPPLAFSIMLKARGAADYRPAGRSPLTAPPVRGHALACDCDGIPIRGVVDAVFIPPGCEENCIGTVFVSEG